MPVAEGMECESELLTLIELGVPLGQGFYLARPAAPWPRVTAGTLSAPGPARTLTRTAPAPKRVAEKPAAGSRPQRRASESPAV